MSIYRKIYEQHYGLIPVDDDGRTYEIHHIDGNRANNDIKKLFSKDWIVTFPNGSIEKVTNLKAFCEKHNLFYATMVKIGNKQIKSHRGFSCEKIEELRP